MAVPVNALMPAPKEARLRLRVANKRMCAEGIAAFDLISPDGEDLPAFTAGAHMDLFLPGRLTRQYSLRNDPRERHRYAIGVLREPGGRGGSAYMHDRIDAGDMIETSLPRNAFELDEAASFTLLVAGGIGVTPILSMAYRLHALGHKFEFHYCARNAARMAFRDEIEAGPFASSTRFHLDDGPQGQKLDLDLLLRHRLDGAHLYACGPSGFLDAVVAKAKPSWPGEAVHREYFANTLQPATTSDATFIVRLARDGRSFEVAPGHSIVEVLSANGVDIPVSCEQGICGTCVTRVVSGTPDHRDLVLTDKQRADHMTLCCSRARTAELVLDL
ncbi:PDR/VanB family oxidoreductase [Aminobacter sp. P9b]|uniref:PDR/VanB family oxidoreductase n=1 Tax=Aminobacter sp. P9b TaxID=3133697 RepID=UPI00324352ED